MTEFADVTRKIILADWIGNLDSQLEQESVQFGFRVHKIGPEGHGYLYGLTGKPEALDRWAEEFDLEWEE